jgi:hypothetical protein
MSTVDEFSSESSAVKTSMIFYENTDEYLNIYEHSVNSVHIAVQYSFKFYRELNVGRSS